MNKLKVVCIAFEFSCSDASDIIVDTSDIIVVIRMFLLWT